MASLTPLHLLTLTFSLLSAAAQPPPPPPLLPQSLVNAVETLASSGFTAMSLTLQLVAPNLPLSSTTTAVLTIFSPPDAAFSASGQPSLAHLLLHFSPLSLSPAALLSFPFSSTLPSLSPSKHLTVTSNELKKISINNIRVFEIPIFDDGFVIVYAIDTFFDQNFTLESTTKRNPKSDIQCLQLESISLFKEASGVLKSRGRSIMATFLELQLLGFLQRPTDNEMKWTVFAPLDEELLQFSGDFQAYSSLFMRHLAPCKVRWGDLEEMEKNGTVLSNSVEGFPLAITWDEDNEMLMVNGVEITFPDMYDSQWLVIHGIKGVISLPENSEENIELMEEPPMAKVEDSNGDDQEEI